MEKVRKSVRRSGVRLRSFSSGHGGLQLIISQAKDVKYKYKEFIGAQETFMGDLMKWSSSCKWREACAPFSLILQSEKETTNAREKVSVEERKELNLRSEIKRKKDYNAPNKHLLSDKLKKSQGEISALQTAVKEQSKENEVVKLICTKQSLSKMGFAYNALSHNSTTLFGAFENIVREIPDVGNKEIENLKFTGHNRCRNYVQRTKDIINSLKMKVNAVWSDLPPPYEEAIEYVSSSLNTNMCVPSAPPDNVSHISDGEILQNSRSLQCLNCRNELHLCAFQGKYLTNPCSTPIGSSLSACCHCMKSIDKSILRNNFSDSNLSGFYKCCLSNLSEQNCHGTKDISPGVVYSINLSQK